MNLEDYLKNNISNPKEISDTISFYSNFNSLFELYKKTEIETKNLNLSFKLLRGQGKYNSKICFIFKDEEHFKSCTSALHRVLNVYGTKIWDVMILYSHKFDDENTNINILLQELLIVNPIVLYIFDDNSLDMKIKNNNNVILGMRIINVNNIDSILEENLSEKIFDLFEYLITYNY